MGTLPKYSTRGYRDIFVVFSDMNVQYVSTHNFLVKHKLIDKALSESAKLCRNRQSFVGIDKPLSEKSRAPMTLKVITNIVRAFSAKTSY